MRLYGWIIVFGSMLFGIGWFANAQSFTPTAEDTRDRGRRDLRRVGPHISNVKRFASEIGMTEQQVQDLEALVEETTVEVRRREQELAQYLRDSKHRVDAILTEDQLGRLKELSDQRWREWRMASIDSSIVWLEENAATDESSRGEVKTILTEYYDRKSELMRARGRHSPEARKQERELVVERDRKLAEVLSAEDLKRFVDERLSRRRGGWDRNRGDRRGEGRRGDGRRGGRRGPPLGSSSENQEPATEATETKQLEPQARGEKDNR